MFWIYLLVEKKLTEYTGFVRNTKIKILEKCLIYYYQVQIVEISSTTIYCLTSNSQEETRSKFYYFSQFHKKTLLVIKES